MGALALRGSQELAPQGEVENYPRAEVRVLTSLEALIRIRCLICV
jgi:hypothetical protein